MTTLPALVAGESPPAPSGARVAMMIVRRDFVKFLRQPARISAAVGTPLILWVFLSAGLSGAIAAPRVGASGTGSFGVFILPGAMTLVALFAAIFGAISIIDDRNEGWLQAALASPAPRWSLAAGKIMAGAGIAFAQALVLMPLVLTANPIPGLIEIAACVAAVFLACVAVSALGFVLAWRSRSVQSFHAIMNLVFMPMWLLSGAFFPVESSSPWLRIIAQINPLTWCTDLIRGAMLGSASAIDLALAGAFTAAMIVCSVIVVSRPVRS